MNDLHGIVHRLQAQVRWHTTLTASESLPFAGAPDGDGGSLLTVKEMTLRGQEKAVCSRAGPH
jgi:hypothetical protein